MWGLINDNCCITLISPQRAIRALNAEATARVVRGLDKEVVQKIVRGLSDAEIESIREMNPELVQQIAAIVN